MTPNVPESEILQTCWMAIFARVEDTYTFKRFGIVWYLVALSFQMFKQLEIQLLDLERISG